LASRSENVMALRSIGTVGGIGVTKSSGMPQTREALTLDGVGNLQIVVESVRWIAVFCRQVPGSCRRFLVDPGSIPAKDAPGSPIGKSSPHFGSAWPDKVYRSSRPVISHSP